MMISPPSSSCHAIRRLWMPSRSLFGQRPSPALPAAHAPWRAALRSGAAGSALATELSRCCGADAGRVLRQFRSVDVVLFGALWPAAPARDDVDLRVLVSNCVLAGAMWVADSVFDDRVQDQGSNAECARAWREIPKIADKLWNDTPKMETAKLERETLRTYYKRYPPPANPRLASNHALLASAASEARARSGSDAIYRWWREECHKFGVVDYERVRSWDMSSVDLDTVLQFREDSGGAILYTVYTMATGGARLSKETVDSPAAKKLIRPASMITALVNDVLSYDFEVLEPGAAQNLVSYFRGRPPGASLDESIDAVVGVCNSLMEELAAEIERASEGGDEELVHVARAAARSVVGMLSHHMQVPRYSRKEVFREVRTD